MDTKYSKDEQKFLSMINEGYVNSCIEKTNNDLRQSSTNFIAVPNNNGVESQQFHDNYQAINPAITWNIQRKQQNNITNSVKKQLDFIPTEHPPIVPVDEDLGCIPMDISDDESSIYKRKFVRCPRKNQPRNTQSNPQEQGVQNHSSLQSFQQQRNQPHRDQQQQYQQSFQPQGFNVVEHFQTNQQTSHIQQNHQQTNQQQTNQQQLPFSYQQIHQQEKFQSDNNQKTDDLYTVKELFSDLEHFM